MMCTKIANLQDVVLCNPLGTDQCSRAASCLRQQSNDEAVNSSGTLVSIYQITWHKIPEDSQSYLIFVIQNILHANNMYVMFAVHK
jgi:hypothetical protein